MELLVPIYGQQVKCDSCSTCSRVSNPISRIYWWRAVHWISYAASLHRRVSNQAASSPTWERIHVRVPSWQEIWRTSVLQDLWCTHVLELVRAADQHVWQATCREAGDSAGELWLQHEFATFECAGNGELGLVKVANWVRRLWNWWLLPRSMITRWSTVHQKKQCIEGTNATT